MQVNPGTWYVVTTDSSCTVTDANGKTLCTAVAGTQKPFLATTMEVTLSDEGATVTKSTFNAALALLGQSGEGGNVSSLPGYFAAYFLQDDGNQYFETDVIPTNETGILLDAQPLSDSDTIPMGCRNNASSDSRFFAIRPRRKRPDQNKLVNNGFGWGAWRVFDPANLSASEVVREKTLLNWRNDRKAVTPYASQNLSTLPFTPSVYMYIFAANVTGTASLNFNGRIWRVGISRGAKIIHNYVPAISYDGKPCMVDTLSSSVLINKGEDEFIVGLTLAQARRMGELPVGTKLTIALPVGWDSDEAVLEAKTRAETNGCVLPVRDYTDGTSAAATYAFRRIWVKRRQASGGTYVDATNTRWSIDWCVDVIGADPETLGYERFRSVEAAAEYWELTPYRVYPEGDLTETE